MPSMGMGSSVTASSGDIFVTFALALPALALARPTLAPYFCQGSIETSKLTPYQTNLARYQTDERVCGSGVLCS